MKRETIQQAVNNWYERTDDIPLSTMTTELDDLVDTLCEAASPKVHPDYRSRSITYRDTPIDCVYEYEPSGIGGDVGEILSASVYIESIAIGGIDISGLLEGELDHFESYILKLHETELAEQKAEAEVDNWLASQGAYAHG